ncbi:hypothetical protein LTR56_028009 [Elasticomyces elasticus]|nr:hypothetical protein LTR56_028009 [Elasticomyces elasticus]KAK3613402.1 hypothetical protein LTR22_028167 [Elasticomyces elasticus]KAK4891113.1 hypothetical protein LTR49_028693 [Elasticomyces elasticus]KAK5719622.1 hypothetical protein LTS12_027663 [Elasticomyces elasticus]
MSPHCDADTTLFNGSNWQELNRLVAQARFHFLQDDDFDDNPNRQCAYLAARYSGAALDWAASTTAVNYAVFSNFDGFIDATRQAFGIAENNITALLRRDLDQLTWHPEVPVFFAEFDRLTLGLGISSHETRVAIVEQKLPPHLKMLLAQQALSFSNYDTMRERFNCMWALDPTRGKKTLSKEKKPRCGSCGKCGHTASDCKAKN